MNKNLHAYRNLGVPCLSLFCGNCDRETAFSAYFETDSKRRKACSVGCCECGSGYAVTESIYEGLYELSFEYDRWKAGEIDANNFKSRIPESCRAFLLSTDLDRKKTPDSSNENGETARTALSPAQAPQGEREMIFLRNSTSDMLGTGVTLAIMFGIVFFGVTFVVSLPEWAVGAWLLTIYLLVMGIGLIAGFAMSYKRFPKAVSIGPNSIDISIRGSDELVHYKLSDASRVNYGEGAKYLTLWLSDGKTYVARASPKDVERLHRYFGKTA